ncbi:hypothetical protein OIU76_006473 [Salix suchowensis]|uniref:Uncharacterized protein n=1 Tax=Salix suchowensis TaxID=1278906 RepID=A0ABQ9C266_9ROSI|nr:hypothetical protein OIU78_012990 [Salix suchowensis]KAJ6336600.1 hypothetical protein OIU76_006473 [Salix suchowensis]KAJ6392490.1 hypothetical protein OIU77_026282 [Salix suchowensis]
MIKLGVQALDAHIIIDLLRGLLTLFFDPAISGLVGFKRDPFWAHTLAALLCLGPTVVIKAIDALCRAHRNSLAPSLGLRKTNEWMAQLQLQFQ